MTIRFIYAYKWVRGPYTGLYAYVGSSFDPEKRDRAHSSRSDIPFDRAIKRYGREVFGPVEILEAFVAETKPTALSASIAREDQWMDVCNTYGTFRTPNKFNRSRARYIDAGMSAVGGRAGRGKVLTEGHKANLSVAKMGNQARLGLKNSEAHNQKLREANLGNRHRLGQTNSETHNDKISEALKGHPLFGSKEDCARGGRRGGPKGRHTRWHVNKGFVKAGCEFCMAGLV